MGILGNLFYSWKKSSKLRKLQLKISPPNQGEMDFSTMFSKASEREDAIEEFLNLCVSDPGVQQVMEVENLSRSDLRDLYQVLMLNGLGQWVKGHYAALSTIAYFEPLMFSVRAKNEGVSILEICDKLLDYWEGKIPQGRLFQ